MIWAVTLLTTELSPRSLTAYVKDYGIRSLIRIPGETPRNSIQCSTPIMYHRRQPQSCFGKNQLLPNSISFSLLTTSHPRGLHVSRVRTSPLLSERLILLMVSSSGFGSLSCDIFALLTLGFPASAPHKGLDKPHNKTRWLVLQKARCHPACARLQLFVSKWFQVLFHRPQRPTFNLSLTVLVHYRWYWVFSLG